MSFNGSAPKLHDSENRPSRDEKGPEPLYSRDSYYYDESDPETPDGDKVDIDSHFNDDFFDEVPQSIKTRLADAALSSQRENSHDEPQLTNSEHREFSKQEIIDRYEQERKIKLAGKVQKFVRGALIAAGIIVAASAFGAGLKAFEKKTFAHMQEKNIENSTILQENNITAEDIDFKFGIIQFEKDGVKYTLKVNAIIDGDEGPINYDGGIYEGEATYEVDGKKITKTFKTEDKHGVSIDRVLTELGTMPKNPENVIE